METSKQNSEMTADFGARVLNSSSVFQAIRDLYNNDQIVTREAVCRATGLKMSVVDDHISRLLTHEKVIRVRSGVYRPTDPHPPARPISKTVLPSGIVKLEIDDIVLDLTPAEARALGSLFAGDHISLGAIEAARMTNYLANEINERLNYAQRQIQSLQDKGEAANDKAR